MSFRLIVDSPDPDYKFKIIELPALEHALAKFAETVKEHPELIVIVEYNPD